MTVYEVTSIILELYVCGILTVEYVYDRNFNEHIKSMKRRTKRNFDFERLTDGEGK